MRLCYTCNSSLPDCDFAPYSIHKCKGCVKKSAKEYQVNNAAILSEKKKIYYSKVIVERRNEKKRIRYEATRDEREAKRDAAKLRVKEWRIVNAESIKAKAKESYPKYRIRRNHRQKEMLKANPTMKIAYRLRTLICLYVKNQKASKMSDTFNLTGCTVDELKVHLESQFLPGMSWDNHTRHGWHIDHIKPCSNFDLSIKDEQYKCFHYTNLQPLWAFDNLSKGNRELKLAS